MLLGKFYIVPASETPDIDNIIYQKPISANGDRYICYISNKNITNIPTEEILEDNLYFAVYAQQNDINKAYKQLSDDEYLFIIRDSDNENAYTLEIHKVKNADDLNYLYEATFSGGERTEILDSKDTLVKQYRIKKISKKTLLVLIIAIFFCVVLAIVFSQDKVKVDINKTRLMTPAPAAIKPLSEKELSAMKRHGSIMFIEDLHKRVLNIHNTPELKDTTKIELAEIRYNIAAPKITLSAAYKTTFSFPAENTVLENNSVYAKSDSTTTTIERTVKDPVKDNAEVCLKRILEQKNYSAIPIERQHNYVKFKFDNFNASTVLSDFEHLVRDCDGYFDILHLGQTNNAVFILEIE